MMVEFESLLQTRVALLLLGLVIISPGADSLRQAARETDIRPLLLLCMKRFNQKGLKKSWGNAVTYSGSRQGGGLQFFLGFKIVPLLKVVQFAQQFCTPPFKQASK